MDRDDEDRLLTAIKRSASSPGPRAQPPPRRRLLYRRPILVDRGVSRRFAGDPVPVGDCPEHSSSASLVRRMPPPTRSSEIAATRRLLGGRGDPRSLTPSPSATGTARSREAMCAGAQAATARDATRPSGPAAGPRTTNASIHSSSSLLMHSTASPRGRVHLIRRRLARMAHTSRSPTRPRRTARRARLLRGASSPPGTFDVRVWPSLDEP